MFYKQILPIIVVSLQCTLVTEACNVTDSGYRCINDVYFYKYYSSPLVSFYEANKICKADGGHLATFRTKEAMDFIWYHLQYSKDIYSSLDPHMWIGIENPNNTNCFNSSCTNVINWIDGTSFEYQDFMGLNTSLEFHITRKERKLCAKLEPDLLIVTDSFCHQLRRFFCEIPPPACICVESCQSQRLVYSSSW